MTVEIRANFEKSIPAEGVYKIKADIIDAQSIELDVFVFDAESDTFLNVASVYDMETWPVGKQAAQDAGLQSYRDRGVEISFSTLRDATAFVSVTKFRLKYLAVAWGGVVAAFNGSELLTVDSTV